MTPDPRPNELEPNQVIKYFDVKNGKYHSLKVGVHSLSSTLTAELST